ncbi:MAG: hypothetical protein L3K01_00715 [Thermoplasmata archaeon]|nr:hypothetical protein [Thermoplasmata archaeon]
MTGNFGAIELLVALVGAAATSSAFALRIYSGPGRPTAVEAVATLRRWAPAFVGLALLLALGAALHGIGRGVGFEEGLVAGGLAALAVGALEVPGEPDGPGPLEQPVLLVRAVSGVGSAGIAIVAVLGILLVAGSGPAGLFGVPVGAGVLLLLSEPGDSRSGRLRFLAVATALSASTAYVAGAVILRSLVADALLLPLLAAAMASLAGFVGLLLDRVEGPYKVGVPAAVAAGVGLAAAAVLVWMPSEPSIAVAMAAGWFGAATVAYLPKWAVLEPPEAAETARAGTALGVIGSMSGGLRAVGGSVIGFAVAVWVADAAVRLLLPDGSFGISLAATSASVGAAVLAAIRVGTGPRGTARGASEVLDVAAVGWAGLAIVFALPLVVPSLTGVSSAVFGAQLGLGSPTTLSGLVLGATLPFLLASSAKTSRGSRSWDITRRWGAALAPALAAVFVVTVFGPAAVVALVLGATLTGIPLGIFWAAAREATASVRSVAPGSSASPELAAALDAESGWRISAAVIATGVAALGVTLVATGATGWFGF